MIIVDVETSGVDARKNSLLSIGAVDFRNPENTFYGECRAWDGAHIEKEALARNGFTHEQATDATKQTEGELVKKFIAWASGIKEKTLAGHNTSFDRDFLKEAAHRFHIDWPFAQRTLDLHTVAYVDMVKKGIAVPETHGHSALSLDKILVYLGLPEEPMPHNGLNGAKHEAECYSRLIYGKGLFNEYKAFPIK